MEKIVYSLIKKIMWKCIEWNNNKTDFEVYGLTNLSPILITRFNISYLKLVLCSKKVRALFHLEQHIISENVSLLSKMLN